MSVAFVVVSGVSREPGGPALLLQERQTSVQEARSRYQRVTGQRLAHAHTSDDHHLLHTRVQKQTPPLSKKIFLRNTLLSGGFDKLFNATASLFHEQFTHAHTISLQHSISHEKKIENQTFNQILFFF